LVGGVTGNHDGVTLRTSAAKASDSDILNELKTLRRRWDEVADSAVPAPLVPAPGPLERALADHPGVARVVVDTPALGAEARRHIGEALVETWNEADPVFEAFGVEAALEAALETRVALPSGGVVTIEQTEALCAIDVDTAKHTDGKNVALGANLEAAAEIGRQLRLRGIGGIIVMDFVTMTRNDHRRRVIEALRASLGGDRHAVAPGGFSKLGLVEMRRRRTRPSLAQVMGDGPRASALTVALAIARHGAHQARTAAPGPITIAAAADVAKVFGESLRDRLAEATGRAVTVIAESAYDRAEHDVRFG
jgi:ribonuclease G